MSIGWRQLARDLRTENDRLKEAYRIEQETHRRTATERDSLREELTIVQKAHSKAQHIRDKRAEELDSLREDNRNLWQKRNDLVQEVGDLRAKLATLSEGHRICEANMDAEIDRLREALETIANSKGQSPEVDASECRVIARTALKEKGLFKTDRNGVGPEDPRFYDA